MLSVVFEPAVPLVSAGPPALVAPIVHGTDVLAVRATLSARRYSPPPPPPPALNDPLVCAPPPPPPEPMPSAELQVGFQSLGGTNEVCAVSVMMNVAGYVVQVQVIVTDALDTMATA